LNFTIVDEVENESMEAEIITSSSNNSTEIVKIFYKAAPPGMIKPHVRSYPIFTYDCISAMLSDYLQRWLEIKAEYGPLYDMYFSVMYSAELYLEFRVMAFVTALEIYHEWYLEQAISNDALIDGLSDSKIDVNSNPTNKTRLAQVFEYYSDIASIYLKSNKKEKFAELAIDTRNYFTHFRRSLKEKAARDDDLFYLTQDLQLLLQFCLLTLLGFTLDDMRRVYRVDKLRHLKNRP
jgi:hypothetical protein